MKQFFKKHTLIFLLFVITYALSTSLLTTFLQNTFATNLSTYYLIEAVAKYIIAILPVTFMIKWGYTKKSNWKRIAMGFGIGTLALIFCLPNLSLFTLIDRSYYIVKLSIVIPIILACFAIGLLEESAIRGVVLPYFCEKWKTKKHSYLKASLVSSLLFAVLHLSWSIRYFLANGNLTLDFFLENMYQVYYTFCFGMFAAGLTLVTRSILPIVFWHGICDMSAFIIEGLVPQATLNYFTKYDIVSFQNVLDNLGIPLNEYLANGIINLILFLIGLGLIKKADANIVN